MERRTDTTSYGDAESHLKTGNNETIETSMSKCNEEEERGLSVTAVIENLICILWFAIQFRS